MKRSKKIQKIIRPIYLIILSGIILLPVQTILAQEAKGKLISPDWLKTNLSKPDLRIIDMRADIRDYWTGHIPGAVYLDETTLRWPQSGVPGKLIPSDVLLRLLQELGIARKTAIIIYTEINNYRATYLAWALDYLGHENWGILEGGFDRWKKEGHPVSQDYPWVKKISHDNKISVDERVKATLDEVKNRDPKTSVLVDVRPADLYTGRRGTWKRKGHIQGAVNFFWASVLNEDGSWKDLQTMKESLFLAGITPDKTIILYDGQGLMASHTYFSLRYLLGYPKVKVYDGSFNEWSNRDELPVEAFK